MIGYYQNIFIKKSKFPAGYLSFGGGLQVGDEVSPVLLLLETGEDHLGAGDVLLGVDEVLVQGVLAPGDALVDVGLQIQIGLF